MSIDATGTVAIPINYGNQQHSNPIFLYLIVAKGAETNSSMVVGQLLSSDQHSKKITLFLETWLDQFQGPDEV